MKKYHKIQTVFKRDPKTNFKTLLNGEYSLPEFEFLKKNEWVFTEKIDGTNIRIMFDGTSITFGGKTDRAQIHSDLINRLNERFFHQTALFSNIFDSNSVCLYGEGYGAKIQKGGKYRQDQDFVLFDIKVDGWWLRRNDVESVAQKLDIDIVPIIGTGNLFDMIQKTKVGFSSVWGDFVAEGIVARPKTELKTRSGMRIITKLKHKDFQNPTGK